MRVLVLGAAGQLGRALGRVLPGGAHLASRRDADVCDAERLHALVDAVRPDAIVNCAADNRVDLAERDPTPAFAVNDVGAGRVAAVAEHVGALLVHTSSDYVFRGDRPPTGPPYREADAPDPASAYARSKRAGERRVLASASRAVVVRTAGLYGPGGARAKGGSFVDRILTRARAGERLRVVDDQVTAPSTAADVAEAIAAALPRWLARGAPLGIYHVTNAGACSWLEFAREALGRAGLDPAIAEPIETAALGLPAPRPPYSVLANERLAALGLPALRDWRAALAAHLGAAD